MNLLVFCTCGQFDCERNLVAAELDSRILWFDVFDHDSDNDMGGSLGEMRNRGGGS